MKYEAETKEETGWNEMVEEAVWCVDANEELYIIDGELWVKEVDGFFCPVEDSAYPNRYGFESVVSE